MKINGGILLGVIATLLGGSAIVNGIDKEVRKSKEQQTSSNETPAQPANTQQQ